MKAIYDGVDDGDDGEKPTWNDDIDISDIVRPQQEEETNSKKKKKKKKKKEYDEDDGMGVDLDDMDADVIPTNNRNEGEQEEEEEWDGTEEMRKRKLEEYMDELYGMEFNDLVGDLPTRFNYTPVQSQTFGLSAVDILMAEDKELNEYMSIKKYAPYRTGGGKAKWEKLKEFRQKVRQRFDDGDDVSNGAASVKKKRKGKKERLKAKDGPVEKKRRLDTD